MTAPTRTAQIDLLRAAIARSGLSQSQFALVVLLRDPRTLRRWLAGSRPIPAIVLDRIKEVVYDRPRKVASDA